MDYTFEGFASFEDIIHDMPVEWKTEKERWEEAIREEESFE